MLAEAGRETKAWELIYGEGRVPTIEQRKQFVTQIDPFDSSEIKFGITSQGYVLYCVGPNGRDDRGIDNRENGDWPVLERKFDFSGAR